MDSNQGYNLYKWVICPQTRVINLHITSLHPVSWTSKYRNQLFCWILKNRLLVQGLQAPNPQTSVHQRNKIRGKGLKSSRGKGHGTPRKCCMVCLVEVMYKKACFCGVGFLFPRSFQWPLQILLSIFSGPSPEEFIERKPWIFDGKGLLFDWPPWACSSNVLFAFPRDLLHVPC